MAPIQKRKFVTQKSVEESHAIDTKNSRCYRRLGRKIASFETMQAEVDQQKSSLDQLRQNDENALASEAKLS